MRHYLLGLWLLLASIAACHPSSASEVIDDKDRTSSPSDWQALSYTTIAPTPPHWTDAIPARIAFDETRTSRVGTPLGGRVTAVYVQLGEHVLAHAQLFGVTSSDLADLYSARAKAKIDLDAARTNFDRVKALVDRDSIPKKELVTAENDLKEAELTIRTTEQKLAALHVGSSGDTGFVVPAPRDGVVVEKTLATGQQVSPDNGSLVAIADLSTVWVVANVLEDALGGIKVHGKAQVLVDGVDVPVDGEVDQVSAVVDPDRHTVPVRVKLDNASGRLRPNAYAQVKFYDEGTSTLSVPASAVLSDGATQYVYVRDDKGHLVRRDVVVGSPSGGLSAIRAGLSAGESVVSGGAQLLENQLPDDKS